MNLRETLGNIYDTAFRMLPHRAGTGLQRIGEPGQDDPVLLTCNYTLTVRRLKKVLRGFDAWLLVANSRGINVWCAAGGGHLTQHDVISALRTSRVGDHVTHRELILPPLGATGIERRKVTEATGWEVHWGPARLEDLPAYLRRGGQVKKSERFMRFPLWERLELALIWAIPMLVIGLPLAYFLGGGWPAMLAAGLSVSLAVFGLFALLPWIKLHGWRRWVVFALLVLVAPALAIGLLALFPAMGRRASLVSGLIALVSMLMLSTDFEGTTPWYGGFINTIGNAAHIDLLVERCLGDGECVQVCPKAVLSLNGGEGKAQIVEPEECIQCGACIVQCPGDALRLRYDDGRLVGPEIIRSTRMNLAGKRAVEVTPK